MFRRTLLNVVLRSRNMPMSPGTVMRPRFVHDEFPREFDNLPFRVTNRYVCTLVFAVFMGVGFWAPYFILWYQMAKRTM